MPYNSHWLLMAGLIGLCSTAQATEQVAIGAYQDKVMGRWSDREHMQKPVVFNSKINGQKYLDITYLKTIYHFWHQRASINVGGALSHASKHDMKVLNFASQATTFDVTIVSLVPELKLNLWRPSTTTNPYLVWSVGGLSYLSGQRSHGKFKVGKWQFKDYFGIGVDHGHWSLSSQLLHYSGSRILHRKKGFNMPWILSAAYRWA